MNRKLPIGIQDFIIIREKGFCYVDKTARIYELLTGSGKTFFLSRPRRFGKSLLCSTLAAIFESRRELFKPMAGQSALAIDSLDWEWKQHPVIRIDLGPGDYTQGFKVLNSAIHANLKKNAEKYDVPLPLYEETLSTQFLQLIWELSNKYHEQIVVLIDEYDNPLLSTIENKKVHEEIRSALKGFYAVLKSADEHLAFVLLTGVTKFSQVSVFSALNNLVDISLDPRYADLCGITQEELERDFIPELEGIAEAKKTGKPGYLDELKRFYNGYRFSEKPLTVYNPFGLLNHFDKGGKFLPYWFETGTPTFLIKLIEDQHINILELGNKKVWYEDFSKYNTDNMNAVSVLYQSGYLTISDYDEESNCFVLDYPNDEVRSSFASSLLEKYLHIPGDNRNSLVIKLMDALFSGNVEDAINALKHFLASIPYDLVANNENYYQTVVHLIFTMLGLRCRSEVRIAAGRLDTLVETGNYVYCFEFKLQGAGAPAVSAEDALRQIDSKEYLLPWQGSGKKLVKVGVVFNAEKRNIGEWSSV